MRAVGSSCLHRGEELCRHHVAVAESATGNSVIPELAVARFKSFLRAGRQISRAFRARISKEGFDEVGSDAKECVDEVGSDGLEPWEWIWFRGVRVGDLQRPLLLVTERRQAIARLDQRGRVT